MSSEQVSESVETASYGQSVLAEISREMVKLYKELFGRGPTKVRTYWTGPDALTVILEETADRILLDSGTMATLAPQLRHTVEAHTESVFLTVIGEQPEIRALASEAAAGACAVQVGTLSRAGRWPVAG